MVAVMLILAIAVIVVYAFLIAVAMRAYAADRRREAEYAARWRATHTRSTFEVQ